jgi:acyl dehydratase
MADPFIKPLRGARLYLEDLTVGQRFSTAKYAIDADQIRTFAAQFDPQPFHLDDAAARDSVFGGLAASGWHTAAITMRLLVTSDLQLAWGMIGASAEVSWPKPTRPGDVLQVDSEVLEIKPSRSRPDRGMVKFRNETRNQRGEVVQLFLGTVMVPRRPAAPDAAGL